MAHGQYDRRHTREWLASKRTRADRVTLAQAQARSDKRTTDNQLKEWRDA